MNPMHQPLQSIIQHLFQANTLDDVSRQRLETFVEQYPSFGIGHFLLSNKLRAEDPNGFQEATQRTGLYFSNPLWLRWLLDNDAIGKVITQPSGPATQEPITAASVPDNPEPATEEPAAQEATTAEPVAAAHEPTIEESSGIETASAADELLLSIEKAKGLRESLQKINDDFTADAAQQEQPVQPEQPIQDEEIPYVLDEPVESPAPAPVVAEPAPPTPMIPEPAPAAAPVPDLVFEPYHTIDYFASQGIRLKLDENPGDALGKQLKSFTDWLKVMRRLPQKDREASVPDRVAEQAVQAFAAHSILSKDVVTETMADVLIKQGMRDRARAIYEKLSLLNPDKKAYFAAKIEQLNIP